MTLDKSRISELSDSFKKIPKQNKNSFDDPFVARNQKARKEKRKNVSGELIETRSQKDSEDKDKLATLEWKHTGYQFTTKITKNLEPRGTGRGDQPVNPVQ